MRIFFFLSILAGLAIGVAYPWYAQHSQHDVGIFQAFDGSNYLPVAASIAAEDAPVEIMLDLTTGTAAEFAIDRTVLTLTATVGGQTVLAEALTFAAAQERLVSPQSPERIYRTSAGSLAQLGNGDVVFRIGPGDAEGIDIRKVDIVLVGGGIVYDERAQPLGISLITVGVVGLVLAFRRRREGKPPNRNSQPPPPPPPRWGRGPQ